MTLPENIQELVQLAAIYFEDGAPQTAADRLRKAADEMQKIADQRAAYIENLQTERKSHA